MPKSAPFSVRHPFADLVRGAAGRHNILMSSTSSYFAPLASLFALAAVTGCGIHSVDIPDDTNAIDPSAEVAAAPGAAANETTPVGVTDTAALALPASRVPVISIPGKPPALKCAAKSPFKSVAPVDGVPSDRLGSVTLSPDEREIFFTRSTATGSLYEIARATRASRSDAFAETTGAPTDANGFHRGLALSRDGLSLVATVRVPGVNFAGMTVKSVHRASSAASFGAWTDVGFSAVYPYSISQMAFTNTNDFLASVSMAGTWRVRSLSLLAPTLESGAAAQPAMDPATMAGGAVATSDGSYAYVGVSRADWPTTGILFGAGLAARETSGLYAMPTEMGAPLNDAAHGSEPQWLSSDECRLYYVELTSTARRLMVASK